jgi:prepilin-type N-terminal cleavage/methylation domain-containing protein
VKRGFTLIEIMIVIVIIFILVSMLVPACHPKRVSKQTIEQETPRSTGD